MIRTCTWASGRRELQRVLDQVREDALDLDRVDVDERALAREVDAIAARQILHRLANEIVERPDLGLGLRTAGFEPREVEQIADQPAEPLGVDGDRVEQHAAVLVAEDERLAAQRADRGRDPGQRRAEVVRDGAQQRGLDEVAAAQRLGLERLLLQAAAVERNREQRCERRQEALPHGEIRVGIGRRVERADRAPLDLERESGRRSPPAPRRPQLDLGARDPEHGSRLLPDPAELGLERLSAEEMRRDLGEQRRLPFALLGVRRPAPVPGGELADHDAP